MKKTGLLFFVLLLFAISGKPQALPSQVVANAGGFDSNGSLSWSYTVGEMATDYYSGSTSLGCGFQQSFQDLLRKVILTLFLEGLYEGPAMHKAQSSTGDQYPGEVADRISISLHHPAPPFDVALTVQEVDLLLDGTAEFSVDLNFNAEYFLSVHNRNHLETWSSVPLSFNGQTVVYNFSDAQSRAYGNNMKALAGDTYGFFAGDANQDGLVNETDIDLISQGAASFTKGYLPADVNGDGLVDAIDLIKTDNNSAVHVVLVKP